MSTFKQIRKNLKYTLLVVIIRVLLVIIRMLPRKLAMRLGSGLGRLAFKLMRGERSKTINNLIIAYGDKKSDAEIRTMAKEVWLNLGKSGVEFAIKMGQRTGEIFQGLGGKG